MKLIKKLSIPILIVFLVTLVGLPAIGQIQGPTTGSVGSSSSYSYNSSYTLTNPCWQTAAGYVESQSSSGNTYYVTIRWSSSGSTILYLYENGAGGCGVAQASTLQGTSSGTSMSAVQPLALPSGAVASKSITVSPCTTPSNPLVIFSVSSNVCGSKTISFVIDPEILPPAGVTYYWQTSATGTSTANGGSSYTAATSGTYYLRALKGTCWSTGSASTGAITVNSAPASPAAFTVSTNSCNDKILTKPTEPNNIKYYWQDSPTGSETTGKYAETTFLASETKTYYLRSYNPTLQCWGGYTSKSVSVDKPSPPAGNSLTACEWDSPQLSTTGYASNLNWYNSAGELLAQGLTYAPSNLNAGVYAYKVKNISAGGCESLLSADVTLTVKVNCDELLNWSETRTYGLDENKNPVIFGASRSYLDAFGNTLQHQVKDIAQNRVWAKETILNADGEPVLTTLPAPINSNEFAYKYRFVTTDVNSPRKKYSSVDFDSPSGSGSLNAPNPVSNNGPGTLGWYYSSANTLEPLTATSSYPYMRNWTEKTSDPKLTKSAGPGDLNRMGAGHEMNSERQKITNELNHYLTLRPYFVPTKSIYGTSVVFVDDFSTTSYTTNQGASVTGSKSLTVKSLQNSGTPGIRALGGSIRVDAGKSYSLRLRGYKSTAKKVNLYVEAGNVTLDLVAKGEEIPVGSEATQRWVTSVFTVPSNVTMVRLGALWSEPQIDDTFVITGLELVCETASNLIGYKTVATDPDGKKGALFHDFEGRILASALIVNGSSFTNWSYSYYDDLGQLVAQVAPNRINLTSSAKPQFATTFKYDHLGQIVEMNSVDQGRSQYVYSDNGLVRFSQNEEQRNSTPKRFSYINYDKYDRVVEFGEYSSNGADSYFFESVPVESPSDKSVFSIKNQTESFGITIVNDPNNRCSDYVTIEYDDPSSDLPQDDGLHSQQRNTLGQITKTKNKNCISWYSYDVEGNVEWIKKSISGFDTKTVDYIYDYLGKVKDVIYQKGKGDTFYHHYVRDANFKLAEFLTSKNGVDKTSHVKYKYYAHGPLKRVEVANRQGVDFTYTISGKLKSINNGDPSKDPGMDGIAGGTNSSFMKDLFGMTMHYNSNDFTSSALNQSGLSLNEVDYPQKFTALPRAISYNSPASLNQHSVYTYKYNDLGWMEDARWGTVSGSGPYSISVSDRFRESAPSYDANGNLLALVRKNKNGVTTSEFNYTYSPGTNKLASVKNGTADYLSYSYNSNGQTTQVTENGKVSRVEYNAYGLPKSIKDNNNQIQVSYEYDDQGKHSITTVYKNGSPFKNTYYVYAGDNLMSIYQRDLSTGQSTWQEVPLLGSGRIGVYRPVEDVYLYEFDDQLGNVRAVMGQPLPKNYVATMESELASMEEPPFKNVSNTRSVSVLANKTVNGNEAARLNQNNPVGPTLSLAVSPGDKIDISAWAYYEGGASGLLDQNFMLQAIATAFGGVSGSAGEAGRVYTQAYNGFSGVMPMSNSSSSPAAFLTYVLYDKNFNRITFGSAQVTTAGNMNKEKLAIPQLVIEEQGYIQICVLNRENTLNPVYFDDLSVSVVPSPVVAGADYYPFGLPQDGREITDEPYRYGFQGQFSEKDSTSGWNQFQLRMYDGKIGRWLTPDPKGQYHSPYLGFGNTPFYMVDRTGGLATDPVVKTMGMRLVTEEAHQAAHMAIGAFLMVSVGVESGIKVSKNYLGAVGSLTAYEAIKSYRFKSYTSFKPFSFDLKLSEEFRPENLFSQDPNRYVINRQPLAEFQMETQRSVSGAFVSEWALKGVLGGIARTHQELARQNLINNLLLKNIDERAAFIGGTKSTGKFMSKVKFVGKAGGVVFAVWGFVDTNNQYNQGKITKPKMVVDQVSNGIGLIPGYGTAWSIGWNLGGAYGPSKWYGENDDKWFE